MQAWLLNKPMIIVLLDSITLHRVADAQQVKRWLELRSVSRRSPRRCATPSATDLACMKKGAEGALFDRLTQRAGGGMIAQRLWISSAVWRINGCAVGVGSARRWTGTNPATSSPLSSRMPAAMQRTPFSTSSRS